MGIFCMRETNKQRKRWVFLLFFTAFAFIVSGGCTALKHSVKDDVHSEGTILTPDEYNVSRAMSNYMAGLLQEWGGNGVGALEFYKEGLLNDPDSVILLSRIAILALRMGNTAVAISTLEDIVKKYPDNIIGWITLGDAYFMAGLPEDALRAYRGAAVRSPEDVRLQLQITSILLQNGRDKEALEVLQKALLSKNNLSSVLSFCYSQGAAFLAEKNNEMAAKLFEFIADNAPAEKAKFNLLVGSLLADMGQIDNAIKRLKFAVSGDDATAEAYLKLAALFAEKNEDKDSALKVLGEAREKFPDSIDVLFAYASYLYMSNKFAEAITFFENVMAKAKEQNEVLSENFFLAFGASLERKGEFEKAETIFKEGIARYPKSHFLLNYLAYMWAEQGKNLDEGLDLVNRALTEEPNNGAYVDTLGWLLFKKGKLEEALTAVQKANDLLKKDPVINEHLGDIFDAMGDKQKAVEAWKESFRIDSSRDVIKEKLTKNGVDIASLLSEIENKGDNGEKEKK